MSRSPYSRPSNPSFKNDLVEDIISTICAKIPDTDTRRLFSNAFPYTLDQTVSFRFKNGEPDTYISTGDIPAMWLRDSTAQIWPYLPFAQEDQGLSELITGVIMRQASSILIDPYANAFTIDNDPDRLRYKNDLTEMRPGVYERKWELDSPCYFIRLSFGFWKSSGEKSFFNDKWRQALKLILQTFREQQRLTGPGPYKFQRETTRKLDIVSGDGYGTPINPNGLISSLFRPSDDVSKYLFNIPANFFAIAALQQAAEISLKVYQDEPLADECKTLGKTIEEALSAHSTLDHTAHGQILPYEIDGFGNSALMDDANAPSLLSLPYFDCIELSDPVYQSTRSFILSESNPYYFKGSAGAGIGSPHTGEKTIWPLSIAMQGLTAQTLEEQASSIEAIAKSHADSQLIHESFNCNDSSCFTREEFGWANSLFAELVIRHFAPEVWQQS